MTLNRKKKALLIAALSVSLIGGTLYKLADRYLIEHVEAVVSDAPLLSAVGQTQSETASISQPPSQTTAQADSPEAAQYDDWNYVDDDTEIHITQVQTGSGSEQITYYVADVQLRNSADLLTALAKNKFGRNIIEDTSEIAAAHDAILAINGDYYGFRDDGVVIRNGTLYRDDPARDGIAWFNDGTFRSYDELDTSSSGLLTEGALHSFSFGPILMKDGEISEDLDNVKIDSNFGNRSIDSANPRTGVGMIAANHFVFVVVDGRQTGYSKGMTLNEFAQVFADLGVTDAYNLDGGGSSTMYFMGNVVNSPGSKGSERGVSDILYVAP